MRDGIWLGIIERTEEHLIGTEHGVVKCRTGQRLPGNQRWDWTMVTSIPGTTWKPVPGHQSDHVPV